ncbi:hypothetical protein HMPREF1621_04345 [Escherichia coli A25922R]|nr:hypothetical protein HMPREF9549_02109 [Escherichia coli MS 185-1]EFJ94451.1 hypothetical protein HMPREF9531_00439 [Escherichia coli MS 45-1]EFU48263.1 hypothetical protein HMPREF9539_01163 [Escherichia coli MS 110-3]EFU54303.1 hypothetical protein HMPREF9544_00560 [Escherichia coli MS 153-1]EFU57054.1 hypothetical protein HMPREF9545_03163 [Escherichia coli MS 16-3]ESC99678.1 hypothetical protein HMPREF1593_01349 [Escherichia coli 907391]ESD38109.1 hypothetical protein HMPREF1604_03567 [Esc
MYSVINMSTVFSLSPKGARGLTEYFFDVVISLEAARWALFSCQTNVTIKLRNMTSL